MKKLAIMGGSYDPVHMGHIAIATGVCSRLDLPRLVMLPAYIPPHKINRRDFASAKDRFNMLEIAVRDYDKLSVSDLEICRGGISYTYDTVKRLENFFPDTEFFFIIGGDSVERLLGWYKSFELLRKVKFIAVERPGYNTDKGRSIIYKAYGQWAVDRILSLKMPERDISSTEIRRRVKEGLSIEGMVAPGVIEYIEKNGIYR